MVMLGATHDIRKVAIWLGHAHTRTTEAYLRADPTEKLEAMEAVLPPELRRGRFRATDALIASLLAPSGEATIVVPGSAEIESGRVGRKGPTGEPCLAIAKKRELLCGAPLAGKQS
jgi:hypothetical protein